MPELELDARLRFLDRSARLLNQTAPATSAHLMMERNTVAEEHGKALNKSQMQDICKTCGTIFNVDLASTSTPIHPDVASSKGRNWEITPDHVSLNKQSNNECHVCRRMVVTSSFQSQQYSRNIQRKAAAWAKLSGNIASPSLEHDLVNVEKVIPANISSKKRAKARKQGGLQAMLKKAKGTNLQSSDNGLNLMDLIKEV
ncbi:MAG: hypothetical protein L6R42_008808 [Xanthoria sp. 1 TBL-2021]|nr:MAG: hypothetical protein L6R42_008808 [Xanthoria sp. 1 TBL-2021]